MIARGLPAALALLVASRIVLLAALGWATGAREFTHDANLAFEFAAAPFAQLLNDPSATPYPPLLPMLTALALAPFRLVLPAFHASRAVFILFEIVAAAVTWHALAAAGRTLRERWTAMAIWIAAPAGWVSTAVMSQDESIATAAAAIVALLVVRKRHDLALAACGFAVVSAKVFFLCPLAALVIAARRPSLQRRLVFAGAPLAAVYAIPLVRGALAGGELPFSGFVLAIFGVNLWAMAASWMAVPVLVAHRLSAPLALAATLLVAEAARRAIRRGEAGGEEVLARVQAAAHGQAARQVRMAGQVRVAGQVPAEGQGQGQVERQGHGSAPAREQGPAQEQARQSERLTALVAASLVLTFLLFYHVNPEYYLIALPLILVLFRGWPAVAAAGALSLPWLQNFFYGVAGAIARNEGGGSEFFVRIYRQSFGGLAPETLERLAVVTAVAALLVLAASLTRRAARA